MFLIRNPKNPDEVIQSELTEDEVREKLKKLIDNNFAQSLANTTYDWTLTQKYYAYKVALEHAGEEIEPIKLACDLEGFIRQAELLQFKLKYPDGTYSAKVFLKSKETYASVSTGFKFCGKIMGKLFFPQCNCPMIVIAEIKVMAENPIRWLEEYGKATGVCAVCGLTLTNEVSVQRGIGPICAQKFGG